MYKAENAAFEIPLDQLQPNILAQYRAGDLLPIPLRVIPWYLWPPFRSFLFNVESVKFQFV
jgi:hypothetical protein